MHRSSCKDAALHPYWPRSPTNQIWTREKAAVWLIDVTERTDRCNLLQEVHHLCEALLPRETRMGAIYSEKEFSLSHALQDFSSLCGDVTHLSPRDMGPSAPRRTSASESANCHLRNTAFNLRSTQLLKDKGTRVGRLPNSPLTVQLNLSTVLLFAQCSLTSG